MKEAIESHQNKAELVCEFHVTPSQYRFQKAILLEGSSAVDIVVPSCFYNLFTLFCFFFADSFPQMFQVIQPERALYVQCSNCVEEKEWYVFHHENVVEYEYS